MLPPPMSGSSSLRHPTLTAWSLVTRKPPLPRAAGRLGDQMAGVWRVRRWVISASPRLKEKTSTVAFAPVEEAGKREPW